MKQYYQNLDGLRAYSALGVLFAHASLPLFGFGWIGVSIFFVISGFLITDILLNSKEQPRFFINFYGKRALRIFPIYFLFLAIVGGIIFTKDINFPTFGYYFVYLQNWVAWVEGTINPFGWILHTWSLAVEEQFYLLWPLLVFFFSRRTIKYLSIITLILCPFYRYWAYFNFGILYDGFSTFSNIDTILAGALIAILHNEGNSFTTIVKGGCYYLFLSFAFYITLIPFFNYKFFLFDDFDPGYYQWIFFMIILIPISFTLISFLISTKNKIVSLIFDNNVIRFLGKRSYGLYLYHLPIFALVDYMIKREWLIEFLKNGGIDGATFLIYLSAFISLIIKISLSISIAWISYDLFEKKFLSYKYIFEK